jgi:YD repeat-containing protein
MASDRPTRWAGASSTSTTTTACCKVVLKNFHNPDGTTRDYVLEENTYDGAGNLTKQVTDNGKTVTTNTLDKLGRCQTATGDPGGLNRTTTFTYDTNGQRQDGHHQTGKPSNVPWVTGSRPGTGRPTTTTTPGNMLDPGEGHDGTTTSTTKTSTTSAASC